MAHAQTARPQAASGNARDMSNTRLVGPWRHIVRAVWLVLVMPCLAVFVISLPPYYQQLQDACTDSTTCPVNALLPGSEHALLNLILTVSFAAIWCGVGFLLFWRRSDDWLALLAALLLVTFDLTTTGNPLVALATVHPALTLPINLLFFPGQAALGAFFLLFPSGHFVPRWTVVLLPLVVGDLFTYVVPPLSSPFNQENWPGVLSLVVTLALFGAIAWVQIYRFRHLSTTLERQQTKWVLLGIGAIVVTGVAIAAIGDFVPFVDERVGAELWNLALPVAALLIPLSIGFSILRYRLWDIDTIINRALVYGSLTALLGALYAVLIIGLESLAGVFTRQAPQPVVLVISTLAIAGLILPVRRRIQAIIDRRFYRRKYDAEKTLASFSTTLQSEVNLEQLRAQLLAVVEETMHPAQVSLWLRRSERPADYRSPSEHSRVKEKT